VSGGERPDDDAIRFSVCDTCRRVRPDVYCRGDAEVCTGCEPLPGRVRPAPSELPVGEGTWARLMGCGDVDEYEQSSWDAVEAVAAGLGGFAGPGELACEVCGRGREDVGPVVVGASCLLACRLCAPVTTAALAFLEDHVGDV
jgi:hypothetical protein